MILIVSSFFYIPTYKYFYDSARYISAQSYVAEPIILYIIYTLLYPVHYLYILYLRHRGIYLPHEPPNARALSKVHCRNSHEYCSIAALDVSLMHTHIPTHTRSLSLSRYRKPYYSPSRRAGKPRQITLAVRRWRRWQLCACARVIISCKINMTFLVRAPTNENVICISTHGGAKVFQTLQRSIACQR